MMRQTNLELADELKNRAPRELTPTIETYILDAWQRKEAKGSSSPILHGDLHLNDLAQEYFEFLRELKRTEAVSLILKAVNSGVAVEHIFLEVFQPVQYHIGHLWHNNQIGVAEEHYFTAVTQLAISQLYPFIFAGREPNGKTMVAASVEGELHELGIRIVSDLFALDGWDTHYLGAKSPISDLASTIEKVQPDMICISASTAFSLPLVRQLLDDIGRSTKHRDFPILVGGIPFIADQE